MPTPTQFPDPTTLPDVAYQTVNLARPLDWVGMENIVLPICITDGQGGQHQVTASIDAFVDLQRADERGIHMSRLYMHLQQQLAGQLITPALLQQLLQSNIESQQGRASQALLKIRYDALLLRKALISDNAGWKRYPITLEAHVTEQGMQLTLSLAVEYSSTCPASAALSRQANAQAFAQAFANRQNLSVTEIHDWLAADAGMAATPHAQRSQASVQIVLAATTQELPLLEFINALEQAVATPVQTAVKREDEQAFAKLNAQNLMFCEDAARRVAAVLANSSHIVTFQAKVAHYESLHPHDAVAKVSGKGLANS